MQKSILKKGIKKLTDIETKKFETSEIAEFILKERYLLKDEEGNIIETPEDMFRRVAKCVAEADKKYGSTDTKETEEKFYQMMVNKDFLPNSPTLMNAGLNESLSACFVVPVPDNIIGIFDAVKHAAIIHKFGGGTGFNFNTLRPKNDLVKTTKGVSSGPVSFMKIFDAATEQIKQGGKRRGANMGILMINHPDILDFISCKDTEGDISNFNISIGITDDFMRALENNNTYDLINPRSMLKTGELKAKKVWDFIIDHSWKNGEPGFIFIDTVNKFNPNPNLGTLLATNPCFTGDQKLLTSEGYKTFEFLEGREVELINAYGLKSKGKVWCSGEKPTITIKLSNKATINCTHNHLFKTKKGDIKEAGNLKGDQLMPFLKLKTHNKQDNHLYARLGFIQGDGNLSRLSSKAHKGFEINFGKNDYDVLRFFDYSDIMRSKNKYHSIYTTEFTQICKDLKFSEETLPYRQLPEAVVNFNKEQLSAFLCGLYSANGSVVSQNKKHGFISFKTTCKGLAENLIQLLEKFSITARLQVNKSKVVLFRNGNYRCKESYNVAINTFDGMVNFYNNIGFIHSYKNKALENLIMLKVPYVTSISMSTVLKKVYDFNEPKENWGVVNGYVVHNCQELPLLDYESCNLGSINLFNFVTEKTMRWKDLKQCVYDAVHFLDNVIDVNTYPLSEIEIATKKTRKIGLGIMGFHDALIKQGVSYSSDEAVSFAEKVMRVVNETAFEASCGLAEKRGPFPSISGSIYDKPFSDRPRNSTRTTIAPTGSLSQIIGVSAGIEPNFQYEYNRIVCDKSVKVRHWALDDPNIKKDVLVTAQDISPEQHIRIQAAFQKYVNSSISKTINFPENATKKDISDAYLLAYKLNCKGITVYRNNSRKKQVMSTKELCPECNSGLEKKEGCSSCPNCGWSKCSLS